MGLSCTLPSSDGRTGLVTDFSCLRRNNSYEHKTNVRMTMATTVTAALTTTITVTIEAKRSAVKAVTVAMTENNNDDSDEKKHGDDVKDHSIIL